MTSFEILGILYVTFTVFLVLKLLKNRSLAKSLQQENSNLKEKVSGFRTFIPGRKGILHNFALTQSSTKTNFKVTNHSMIVGFYQNQWVSKEVVELFIDKSDIRDSKIEQILT